MPPEAGPLYEQALTHRSYAFEQRDPVGHNERLEFLGDAILGAVVTHLIYATYPDLAEGEMARLRSSVVQMSSLAELARSIGLGEHIRLGKGEEGSGGRFKPSLLADTLEAVVGAVYIDRGIETVREALVPHFALMLADKMADGARHDAKTALQEATVRDFGDVPEYRVAASGPDHDKRFVAHVYVDAELYGVGSGRSKKQAEQEAAREALVRFGRKRTGAGHGGERDGGLRHGEGDARAS